MREFLLGEKFLSTFIHIIIYVIGALIVYYLIKAFLVKGLNLKFKSSRVNPKRQKTIYGLIMNIIKYLIMFVVVILILKEFGVNTTSLLASLGVVGLVVGLALQDILKDFISGIFIITDKEYEVGDFVTIDGFTGEVKALGLKSTKIKAYTGEIKIINNSSIGSVINYSQYNSNLILDIDVAYEEDTNKVINTLKKICVKISKLPNVKKQVEVLGVQELESSSVKYRVLIETKPYEYFEVKREALKLIKDEFDKQNIKIPYTQLEVHNGKKV